MTTQIEQTNTLSDPKVEESICSLQKKRGLLEWHLRQARLALRIAQKIESDSVKRVSCLVEKVDVLQKQCEIVQNHLQSVYQEELNDLFASEA